MKYIKHVLWILILSILYATGILRFFNISAELLMIFSGVSVFILKKNRSYYIMAVICGVLMSGLGGRGFIFSLLGCIYYTVIIMNMKKNGRMVFKMIALNLICFFVFEALFYVVYCIDEVNPVIALTDVIVPSALYNSVAAMIILFLVKRSFAEKERYIF